MDTFYLDKLFQKDIKFYNGFETFCYQNCQKILLEEQGVKYPELYVNAALSLSYDKMTNKIFTSNKARSLLPSNISKVKRFYYDKNEIGTKEVFELNIKYMVEKQKPIIVGVDSYYLKYATNYKRNHAIHTLVLCGYDLVRKEVYVIDWYPSWFYRGIISIDDFLCARESANPYDGTMFSGSAIKNNWAYIDNITEFTPDTLMKELLDIVFSEYYTEEFKGTIVQGIDAIEEIKKYLLKSESQILFGDIYRNINLVSKRQRLFQQYLECYEGVTGNRRLRNCIEISNNIVKDWDILLMLILKCSNSLNERTKERLEKRFEMLISNETERRNELRVFCNSLYNNEANS